MPARTPGRGAVRPRPSLLFALFLAGCNPPGTPSPSPGASPSPAASPTAAAQSPVAESCVILAQSRFIDDPTPVVIQTEGVTAAECAAIVEHDNDQDDWSRAHPEVVLDAAPTESPLCSEVVKWPGSERAARETVWGNGIAGRNYCFTLNFMANQSQRP